MNRPGRLRTVAGLVPRAARVADIGTHHGLLPRILVDERCVEFCIATELRPRIDEACEEVGRDPATLARTVTVLIADDSADPWWEDMPFDNDADLQALKPLSGAPADIAETLRAFVAEGASSIQIHLDSTTPETIKKLAPVLEAFDSN